MYNIISLNFYNYLNDIDFLNVCMTSKILLKILDDNIFYHLLKKKFSLYFVKNAKDKFESWKNCYLRIHKFEKCILNQNSILWKENDYYQYWKLKYKFNCKIK